VAERTEEMLDQVRTAGYHVVGDLDDMRANGRTTAGCDKVATPEEVAESCSWAIKELAEYLEQLRDDSDDPAAMDPAPAVGPDDGIPAILELIEHIRAVETGQPPRPAYG
jgi:hypothetical protein